MARPPITSRPVRGALFGYGSIGPVHMVCVRGSDDGATAPVPDAAIVAVAEPDPARAARVPAGIAVYPDYATLLREATVDVAHICLPHNLHAPAVIAAAECGLSIICEKPMALTAAEARRMRDAVRTNGVGFSLISQNRLNREKAWLKECVAAGDMGALRRIDWRVDWFRSAAYYAETGGWRGCDAQARGGALSNQAYHTLDLAMWLADAPAREVTATTSINAELHPGIDVPDTLEGELIFENGIRSRFFVTVCGNPKDVITIEVVGAQNGALTRVLVDGNAVVQQNVVAETPSFDAGGPALGKACYGSSHQENIARSYEAFMSGARAPVDAETGIRVLAVIDAILASDGRPVRVDAF